MIKNNIIEQNKWYIHPGMLDTAICCVGKDGDVVIVNWYNISGKKRKFYMDTKFYKQSQFDRSPYWQEQGTWIDELPNFSY